MRKFFWFKIDDTQVKNFPVQSFAASLKNLLVRKTLGTIISFYQRCPMALLHTTHGLNACSPLGPSLLSMGPS